MDAGPRGLLLVANFLFIYHSVDLTIHEDKKNLYILLT